MQSRWVSGTSSAPMKALLRWKKALRLRQLVEIVGVILDEAISRDKEASRTCRRVLHRLAGLRLHQPNNAVDQRARREVLTSP